MRLDFETILGIIFFVVFFILPAFNRRKKTPGEGAPARPAPGDAPAEVRGQQQPGAPAQAQQSTQAQPSARPRTTHRPPPATRGAATPGTFEQALEEIRVRVREAQLQEDAQRGGAGSKAKAAQPQRGGLVRADPFGGSLVSGEASHISGRKTSGAQAASAPRQQQPRQRPVPGGLGREGVAAPLSVTRRLSGTASAGGARSSERARAMVDTLPGMGPAPARLAVQGLSMDRKALLTGMIWHEILSEPVVKRRRRRTRSRPR